MFLSLPFLLGGSATVDADVVDFRPDDEETAPAAVAAAAAVVESGLGALMSFLSRWSINPWIPDVATAMSSFDLSRNAERGGDNRWSMLQEAPDSRLAPSRATLACALAETIVCSEIQTVVGTRSG